MERSVMQEYLGHVKRMEGLTADLIEELVQNPNAEFERTKYHLTIKVPNPLYDRNSDEEANRWPTNEFQIWTANGAEFLSMGVDAYDHAKIKVPKKDQTRVWEMLQELNVPAFDL